MSLWLGFDSESGILIHIGYGSKFVDSNGVNGGRLEYLNLSILSFGVLGCWAS